MLQNPRLGHYYTCVFISRRVLRRDLRPAALVLYHALNLLSQFQPRLIAFKPRHMDIMLQQHQIRCLAFSLVQIISE